MQNLYRKRGKTRANTKRREKKTEHRSREIQRKKKKWKVAFVVNDIESQPSQDQMLYGYG